MNSDNFAIDYWKLQKALAIELAYLGHENQYRRDGKTPYVNHPMAVMEKVNKYGKICECVAALHDVSEDNPLFTSGYLFSKGVNEQIVVAITAIAKVKGEDYYNNYLPRVKENEYARIVKIADIICNLNDDPTEKQLCKYSNALVFLLKKD